MSDRSVQFAPSRVEGLAHVKAVTVLPDRIELCSARDVIVHRFAEIARWPRPRWLWSALYRLGIQPRWLPVADRDWFHAPADMYFEFYTSPPLKIFMPRDESKSDYASSYFVRLQTIIGEGGFDTCDLG